MIRCSKHTLKFSTNSKKELLSDIIDDYRDLVNFYISLIWNKELELKINLSSSVLPSNGIIYHSRWKQLAYKQSSSIVRSILNKKNKKKYTKPILNNISIELDERFWDEQEGNHFDKFIRITTPYFQETKKRAKTINIPIKNYRQSLKFKDWDKSKTIRLKKDSITFYYEKEEPEKITKGCSIGIDCGYKHLLVDSNGNFYGSELNSIYSKISRKKQGSNAFKKSLKERDYAINKACKNLINSLDIKTLIVEDLKYVKHKSKFSKIFNNKLQRWSYPRVLTKLEMLSEENGILMKRVNPSYTSQTCHGCKKVEKSNRNGENYSCCCGYNNHADVNAALNILTRGYDMVALDLKSFS